MIQSHYTITTSMIANQKKIDAISNNIANAGTKGYKKIKIDFKEALYEAYEKQYLDTNSNTYNIGYGVLSSETMREFSQGIVRETNSNMDIAIMGDGFIKVSDKAGNFFYSRGGELDIISENGIDYLTDNEGNYIMDMNDNRIQLNISENSLSILSDGTVENSGTGINQKIQLVRFQNTEALEMVSSNKYLETLNTGNKYTADSGQIIQSSIEESNVNLATEFVDLIQAQRQYELSARVLQTVDQIQSMANNLRR